MTTPKRMERSDWSAARNSVEDARKGKPHKAFIACSDESLGEVATATREAAPVGALWGAQVGEARRSVCDRFTVADGSDYTRRLPQKKT